MTIQDENLAARLTRLEDIEAIRQLKARYCEICDDDHNTALITSIFTEDGTWEGKGIGKAEGHQEIRELFTTFQQAIKFSQHMVQNPIIEVDGNKATARWYFSACSSTTAMTRPDGRPPAITKPIAKLMANGKSAP